MVSQTYWYNSKLFSGPSETRTKGWLFNVLVAGGSIVGHYALGCNMASSLHLLVGNRKDHKGVPMGLQTSPCSSKTRGRSVSQILLLSVAAIECMWSPDSLTRSPFLSGQGGGHHIHHIHRIHRIMHWSNIVELHANSTAPRRRHWGEARCIAGQRQPALCFWSVLWQGNPGLENACK